MAKIKNTLSILLLILVAVKCDKSQDYVVDVEQGSLRGIKETSIGGKEFFSFLSIPFAKPPVNELRFKDPLPGGPWEGVLDATSGPDVCIQVSGFDVAKEDRSNLATFGKEDCLYLNVYTPKFNIEQSNIPVMVYIHGGAFFCGGAREVDPYVLMNEDIVLVIIQYRLGVFGFLSTEDSVLPGNMGLKDQQLALKWVKKNIFHFGGNPQRITIFGESAGGASVHYQMLSPRSKGLFQRAILQSGTALCPWAFSENHKEYAQKMGKHLHCPLDDGSEAFVKCMQDLDSKDILQYFGESFKWGIGPAVMVPRVDGHFLPDKPEVLLKEGKYNKVDIMTGITKDEGSFVSFFMCMEPHMKTKFNTNFAEIGPVSLMLEKEEEAEKLAKTIYGHYLKNDKIEITTAYDERIKNLYSDWYFGICVDSAALFHVHEKDMNVYLYQLDHRGEKSLADVFIGCEKTEWVCHADDLFYLFKDFILPGPPLQTKGDLKVRKAMVPAWTNFAKIGNPTPPGTGFVWDKATPNNFKYLSIAPQPMMKMDDKKEMRNFWFSQKIKKLQEIGQDDRLSLPEQKDTAKIEL